jgi:pimeloyl-ACP methyl ester carboxylesterase
MSFPASRSSLTLTGGTSLSFVTVGDKRHPAVLLIHGQPSSANSFRDIWSSLAEVAYVVAPDLPGHGRSDVLETTTFDNFAIAVTELLDYLGIRERFIYLHDFGAPVGFRIAMNHPELVCGLIVQSAIAHETGFGPQWKKTKEYWSHPNAENEAAATAHLTVEGVRSTYVRGLPDDVARRISPSLGRGVASDVTAGSTGGSARPACRLRQVRGEVRGDFKLPADTSTSGADGAGPTRSLFRAR